MKRCLIVLAVAVTVLLPGVPGFLNDGLPLDHPVDLLWIFALGFVWLVLDWRPPSAWPLAGLAASLLLLAVLKCWGAAWAVPHGLLATYYPNRADWTGEPARSTAFRRLGATRLDRALNFKNFSVSFQRPPFPLWFMNDNERFPEIPPTVSKTWRTTIPFSARWQGVVASPPSHGPVRLVVDAAGDVVVRVGGEVVLELVGQAPQRVVSGPLALPPGGFPLEVTYAHRGGVEKELALSWQWGGRPPQVIPASSYFPMRPTEAARWRDTWSARLGVLAGVGQILLLVWIAWRCARWPESWGACWHREGARIFILVSAATLIGIGFLIGRASSDPNWYVLDSGSDYLVYETLARRMLFGDWLVWDGRPFYYNPGIQYVLALEHLLVGEGLFMVAAFQHVLGGLTVWILYVLAQRCFDRTVALVAGVMLAINKTLIDWGSSFYDAKVSTFVLTLTVLVLLVAKRRPAARVVAGAGALMGLGILLRGNFWFLVPGIMIWLGRAAHRDGRAGWRVVGVFVLALLAVVSLATIRNAVVSGHFVLTSSNAEMTLYVDNFPPDSVDLTRADEDPVYNRLGLGYRLRCVLEYARQEPGRFLRGWGEKGLQFWGKGKQGESIRVYVPGYLLALWWTRRHAKRGELLLVHLVILGLMAGLVVFEVLERFRAPVIPLFVMYTAWVLVEAARRWQRRGDRGLLAMAPSISVHVRGGVSPREPT